MISTSECSASVQHSNLEALAHILAAKLCSDHGLSSSDSDSQLSHCISGAAASQLSDPLGCDPAWPQKQQINYYFNYLIYKYLIINISRKVHLNIEHVVCVQERGEDNNNHSKVISEVISRWFFFS